MIFSRICALNRLNKVCRLNQQLKSVSLFASLRDQLKFTDRHEWIRVDDNNIGYVGITPYAQVNYSLTNYQKDQLCIYNL
jgi:hypothetical protein